MGLSEREKQGCSKMKITKFRFPKYISEVGELVALEALKDVPFKIKRIYYIYGVNEGVKRGLHAHKQLEQVLICIHGSCRIKLDNGKSKTDILLDDSAEGLFIGNLIWREMYEFSRDAVLLVLASEYYDAEDYIYNYDEFLRHVKIEGKVRPGGLKF